MANRANNGYDVFLSYNRKDHLLVKELATLLVDKAGISPFLDEWHLIPGNTWQEDVEDALAQSESCVVFLGANGLGPWQNGEMRSALIRHMDGSGFRVIPVLLPGADPEDVNTLPGLLKQMTWVDFRAGLDNPKEFDRLVAGIRGEPPGRGMLRQLPSSAPLSNPRRSPNLTGQRSHSPSAKRTDPGGARNSSGKDHFDSNRLPPLHVEVFSRIIENMTNLAGHIVDEMIKAILAWRDHVADNKESFNRFVKVVLLVSIAFLLAVCICIYLLYR